MYHFQKAISYTPFSLDQDKIKSELRFLVEHHFTLVMINDLVNIELLLQIIRVEELPLKVFLRVQFRPELIDQEAPLEKILKTKDVIQNKKANQQKITDLVHIANAYQDVISHVSVGYLNIANFDDHMISTVELSKYIKMVKPKIKQPVTYSDSFYLWNTKLKDLTQLVDFVGIHIYPYTQDRFKEEAIEYTSLVLEATKENLVSKPIIITETGYPNVTVSGEDISNEQRHYIESISKKMSEIDTLVVFYEAFDSKGTNNPFFINHDIYSR